jgi:predicted anti-sigma-YlaC factor YlaD
VSAELDGRLSEFEQALLAGHLKTCPGCAAFRASAVLVTNELRSAPPERLERPISVTRARRRIPLRIAPAVAALAVTAVGLGSLLASSEVRREAGVGQPAESSTSLRLAGTNGPVNLTLLEGLRRARIVTRATTVDTTRIQRPVHGGKVLR